MKTMITIVALAIAALLSSVAMANERGTHLEPEVTRWEAASSPWDDTAVIVAVFHEAFAPDVQLGMYYPHAGKPMPPETTYEGVVALAKRGDAYRILHLRTLKLLFWFTQTNHGVPLKPPLPGDRKLDFSAPIIPDPTYRSVVPERCEIEVPEITGKAIMDVWRRVLTQARYDPPPYMGMDGGTYSFWMGSIAGSLWSPPPDTEPGLLLAVAEAMESYCEKRTNTQFAELVKAVAALGTRLTLSHH